MKQKNLSLNLFISILCVPGSIYEQTNAQINLRWYQRFGKYKVTHQRATTVAFLVGKPPQAVEAASSVITAPAKGPFIYYVITCRGEGGQKMPIFEIFDYFQY